jgi:hypothetical protein
MRAMPPKQPRDPAITHRPPLLLDCFVLPELSPAPRQPRLLRRSLYPDAIA